jgi:hypothetical protein
MFKLVVATVIVAFAAPAVAQIQPDVQFALHNGSVMAVLSDGAGGVRIEYAEPKPSLLQIGVRQGTLLFDGHWQGDALFGRARVFNLVCGPVPYEVQGGVVDRDGTLVLRGPQMRVNHSASHTISNGRTTRYLCSLNFRQEGTPQLRMWCLYHLRKYRPYRLLFQL